MRKRAPRDKSAAQRGKQRSGENRNKPRNHSGKGSASKSLSKR
jgi:hypothetical protein